MHFPWVGESRNKLHSSTRRIHSWLIPPPMACEAFLALYAAHVCERTYTWFEKALPQECIRSVSLRANLVLSVGDTGSSTSQHPKFPKPNAWRGLSIDETMKRVPECLELVLFLMTHSRRLGLLQYLQRNAWIACFSRHLTSEPEPR